MKQLIHKYDQLISSQQIINDPLQRALLKVFQCCYDELIAPLSFWQKIFNTKTLTKGIYIWGGVGIGKTFMMDLFFEALPFQTKQRAHFHDFMKKVQDSLKKHQGKKNPLETVAAEIAKQARVLCFDEFFVSDIADAMILERLFLSLFSKGVILIATSNIAPQNLYLKGLHRKRFIPAIDLIIKHCQVIDMHSQQDYRFRDQIKGKSYFLLSDRNAISLMQACFNHLCHEDAIEKDCEIIIENRPIKTKYLCGNVIWFDFNVICHTPRSQVDYLKIASLYRNVFIDNVPIMKEKDKVAITYFIYLVDVFYDKHVKLYLSVDADIEALYTKGDKIFEYQRTISRLHEMQSQEWLDH